MTTQNIQNEIRKLVPAVQNFNSPVTWNDVFNIVEVVVGAQEVKVPEPQDTCAPEREPPSKPYPRYEDFSHDELVDITRYAWERIGDKSPVWEDDNYNRWGNDTKRAFTEPNLIGWQEYGRLVHERARQIVAERVVRKQNDLNAKLQEVIRGLRGDLVVLKGVYEIFVRDYDVARQARTRVHIEHLASTIHKLESI